MTPPYNQKEYVIQLIHKAFEDVNLEDGVSLHETIRIDNYGETNETLESQIKADERNNWKKLIDDPELAKIHGIGGLSFYDAKGLRFHLPAYLCLMIKNPGEDIADICVSLMFTLVQLDEYNRERFSILTVEQRKAVKVFLTYLRYNTGISTNESGSKAIERAIREYWRSLPT